MRSKRKCKCCKKIKVIRSRGQCVACYESARRRVNAGATTWHKLERKKLADPLVQTDFEKALAK